MEQRQTSTPPPSRPAAGVSLAYFSAALIITVLSFAAGLAIGFFGRPMMLEDKVEQVQVAATATPDSAAAAVAKASSPAVAPPTRRSGNENDGPAPTNTAAASSNNAAPPTIMDLVLADTRHFQGEPDAPITIIEFSDFK